MYAIYKIPTEREWHKGRCLNIGEAAHAMPPHASQDVSMALEDAFLFSKLLEIYYSSIQNALEMHVENTPTVVSNSLRLSQFIYFRDTTFCRCNAPQKACPINVIYVLPRIPYLLPAGVTQLPVRLAFVPLARFLRH